MIKIQKKIVILILLLVLITSCSQNNERNIKGIKISKSDFMIDTYITITLYGTEDETILDMLFTRIKELENILSVHVETSDLYKIKENAGTYYTKVSGETMEVIEKAIYYSKISDGLFDVTSGPLIELFHEAMTNEKIPSQKRISNSLKFIDYKKIIIDKERKEIMLEDDKMSIDLGAIAKGYIGDKITNEIKKIGIESAIINLGGNVILIGSKPDGEDFDIGIQEPDEATGNPLGVISASDMSIVTSGDYERFFIQDGVRYHHILNPFTGFPSNNNLRAVSVVSKKSFDGDALSTTLFLLGLEKGLEMVNDIDDVDAIFITKEKEIYLSTNIEKKFNLINSEYIIKK